MEDGPLFRNLVIEFSLDLEILSRGRHTVANGNRDEMHAWPPGLARRVSRCRIADSAAICCPSKSRPPLIS